MHSIFKCVVNSVGISSHAKLDDFVRGILNYKGFDPINAYKSKNEVALISDKIISSAIDVKLVCVKQ